MKRPALALLILALLTLACSLMEPTANLSATVSTATPHPSPAPLLFPTKPTATPEQMTCQVIAPEALHLRDAPNIEGRVIAYLKLGDVATIEATAGAWYQVQTDRGAGYVHSHYCEVVTP